MSAAKRKFAVFDIDGTLIRWQLYHAIVEELITLGFIDEEAGTKIENARKTWRNRSLSFEDYEMVMLTVFKESRSRIHHEEFTAAVDAAFDKHKDQVYTYTRDLIASFKEEGRLLFAISGSQHEIVEKLGTYYGFDAVVGAQYKWTAGGTMSNSYFSPAVHGKADVLKKLCETHKATYDDSYAVGDSRGDAAMFELVTHPIAFNPDNHLFEIASARGWDIVIERKNMIYKLKDNDGTYVLAQANTR